MPTYRFSAVLSQTKQMQAHGLTTSAFLTEVRDYIARLLQQIQAHALNEPGDFPSDFNVCVVNKHTDMITLGTPNRHIQVELTGRNQYIEIQVHLHVANCSLNDNVALNYQTRIAEVEKVTDLWRIIDLLQQALEKMAHAPLQFKNGVYQEFGFHVDIEARNPPNPWHTAFSDKHLLQAFPQNHTEKELAQLFKIGQARRSNLILSFFKNLLK